MNITTLKQLAEADLKLQVINRPDFPYPVKTAYKDKTANELERSICAFFKVIGGMAERVKNMGREVTTIQKHDCSVFGEVTQENRKFIPGTGRKGTSDVKALYGGKSYAIEVKIGRDRMSQAQKEYKADFERAGGYYIEAKTFEQFSEEFYKIKQLK